MTPSESDLSQTDFRRYVETRLGTEPWVTLYLRLDDGSTSLTQFCALISNDVVDRAMTNDSWDLTIGSGGPGCSVRYEGDKQVATYDRWGLRDGVEPFVLKRSFNGLIPDVIEIIEEFRLFHNLYFDASSGVYSRLDDNGDAHEVIRVTPTSVKARLFEIRQFLAFKDAHMALFFERDAYAKGILSDEQMASIRARHRAGLTAYTIVAGNTEFHSRGAESFSRLMGKRLVQGMLREDSRIWPYDKLREHAEFVIGTDSNGAPLSHTCDPEKLANFFGKNAGAPNFLTPVFFRREVLGKYYNQPERYSVEDSFLRCKGLWGLRMDNNHETHVVVYLGDLGEGLSYSEQLYWKSFNVVPDGTVSRTAFRRGILAEFADPTKVDLLFKQHLETFRQRWRAMHGWDLFRELAPGDEHLLTALRVPLTNDQSEFDGQVLALTKIMIDSLNETEVEKRAGALDPNTKGIGKFEAFLTAEGVVDAKDVATFLRNLQNLRSAGVGHRKGGNYVKVSKYFKIGERSLRDVFANILASADALLEKLTAQFLSNGARSAER